MTTLTETCPDWCKLTPAQHGAHEGDDLNKRGEIAYEVSPMTTAGGPQLDIHCSGLYTADEAREIAATLLAGADLLEAVR